MLLPEDIEQFLRAEFPATRLVARWADPALGLPNARARIFVPDMHLLSDADAAKYPNTGFRLAAELRRFLRALVKLKNQNPGELEVLHLGDLFDIWRATGPGGAKRKVDGITADFGEEMAFLFFGPPGGVRAGLLAGNHDYDLHNLSEWNSPRFWFLNDSPAGQSDALAIHGDQFDFVERFFPNQIQAAIVRLFKQVSSGEHELDHEQLLDVMAINDELPKGDHVFGAGQSELGVGADDGAGLAVATNVVKWHKDVGSVGRYFEPARQLAVRLQERGRDIRLVICGHSHDARIVAGDRGDGVTFVLMDCGAWLGQCRLDPSLPFVPSAQLGVLAGNDARIYQLL